MAREHERIGGEKANPLPERHTAEGAHTPGPWRWQGEDYRGGWGWQLLVGANGEGIVCGEGKDGPYKHLRAAMPIDPRYCKTGFAADADSAPCVHVQQADARLIAAAPDLLAALRRMTDLFQTACDVREARDGKSYTMVREEIEHAYAAIAKAEGK